MNSLQIDKVLNISLNHLTEDDEEKLVNGDTMISAYDLDGYGWLVVVPPESAETFSNEYSKKFIKVLSAAQRSHCDYIKFDSEGIDYTDNELN
jgi:hypothetical protein